MTYDEFKKAVEELDINLKDYWCIGGRSGGSCWGHESTHYYTSDEREPKKTNLLTIIKELYPDLSAVRLMMILESDNVYSYEEDRDYEYYGNYTDNMYRTLNLDVLYELLEK